MPTERRRFSRIQFDANATLINQGHRWPAQLEDISLKGALIELPEHHCGTGDEVTLVIELSGAELTVTMPATVAHIEGRQLGLSAREMALDDISHLRRLVELNLGDEALLERELEHLIGSAR